MAMANDLMFRPARELAEMVRSGEVTSRELVESSFEAIGRLNDELNAFVTLCEERALAEADAVGAGDERPLAGVPIAIKDLAAITEGVRTTFGSASMADWIPDHDSALVRRVRDAGAIIVGKTNLPEFGILPVTEPDLFGPCHNPWDTSRTPGGSSGGSASAVAAGMVPIAHANDGGGSIRIPASCCGLVGLKPSRGRASLAPDFAEFVGGIAIEGCVSRTVADTALMLDIVSGYETGDPYWAPPPSAPFVEAVDREPDKLRIAFVPTAPIGIPVHEHCSHAAIEAASVLESFGHEVVEAEPPGWNDEGYIDNFITIWIAGTGAEMHTYARLMGMDRLDVSKTEALTQEMVELAKGFSAVDYLRSLEYLQNLSREVVAFWDDYDVLVTSTLAQPPIPIGGLRPQEGEPAMKMLENAAGFVPLTPVFNVTGQPAISLPMSMSPDGLPIGVQLVGPPAGEELLLSLSAQVESAVPWMDRRPELAAA
jgi:amidase